MDAERPGDTRTEQDFAAVWSSDGVTRSLAPTATGVPVDLPFLFAGGQRFGPYLIVRPIGKGGMGQVYEAEETDSGRRVAVKILSRGIGDDEERERFLQEGRLAASLSHPNTVYVFGTTEVQGFPVIAMELAPSGTLKDLVVPGTPMAPAQAVDAILQVIAGLEAAASIGILHRDIKPSNCFVAADGRVLVGDFGLSIATLGRAGGDGDAPTTILGTPGFASPEQLRGDRLDVRSDIYSVGATIYYLLTGTAPFDDPDLRTMMTRVATEPPPALALSRPDLPSRLTGVVSKCLAKKPGDRYASYAAVRAALEPFRSADIKPAPLGRRFIAGFLDGVVATLPIIPLNAYLGSVLDARNPVDLLWAQIPAFISVFSYYTILEGRFGCGAGKAVMNLRVVDEAHTAPGMRKALVRALILLLPGQLMNAAMGLVALPTVGRAPQGAGSPIAPILAAVSVVFGMVVLGIMFSTARRRNGFAGLHDLATKTRVVIRPPSVEVRKSGRRTAAADHGLASGGDRLGPYVVPSGAAARAITAATVIDAYDDRLRRGVWMELLPPSTPMLDTKRRDLGRPARARWLSGRRHADECWDAYEAIEGRALLDVIRTPQPWSRVRHWLFDIADEVAAGIKDGPAAALAFDRIWIGVDDRARLLDFAPPTFAADAAKAGKPRVSQPDLRDAQRCLYGMAAGALRGVDPEAAGNEPLDMPLPLASRAMLDALRAGTLEGVDALRTQAELQLRNPAAIPIRRRATQIGVCAALPVVMVMATLGAVQLLRRAQLADPDAYALKACTGQLVALDRLGSRMTIKDREDHRLIEIYIAEHLGDAVEESAATARAFPVVNRVRGEHEVAARAIANHPTRSPIDVRKADTLVGELIAKQSRGLTSLATPLAMWSITIMIAAFAAATVGGFALLGALIARGGFTFRPFGAALVKNDGTLAGRFRAFMRALLSWSPIAVLCVLVALGPSPGRADLTLLLLDTGLLLLFVGGAVWALLHPSRAYQDRFTGTWIVPR